MTRFDAISIARTSAQFAGGPGLSLSRCSGVHSFPSLDARKLLRRKCGCQDSGSETARFHSRVLFEVGRLRRPRGGQAEWQ